MIEPTTRTHGKQPIDYARITKAAKRFDVNPATIRRMIADGRIKGYRSGARLLRVDLNEIAALMANGA